MSEDVKCEDFLARWSRRKQEAKTGHAAPQIDEPADAQDLVRPSNAAEEAAGPNTPEPDLSSLPPIEQIDATTDIRAFLRKGTPPDLSREALRRAWSSDPAIRDFVGLAENAWDFNDPNAMPGFGPLDYSAEQVEALVDRIVGGVAQAAEHLSDVSAEAPREPEPREAEQVVASNPVDAVPTLIESNPTELQTTSAASQTALMVEREDTYARRRTHGGALPE
jgi:Protein of unknown function (DUF3306)